jgi:hypothetical protein
MYGVPLRYGGHDSIRRTGIPWSILECWRGDEWPGWLNGVGGGAGQSPVAPWPVLTGVSGAAATGHGGGLFPVQNKAVVVGILSRGESGSRRHRLGFTMPTCSLTLWSSMRTTLRWSSNQKEGWGSTRRLRWCFLSRRRSSGGSGAAWHWWWLAREDGGSFSAPRLVIGMGFYRGSTPDVLCKDTRLILSPNRTSNRRSHSDLKGDKNRSLFVMI